MRAQSLVLLVLVACSSSASSTTPDATTNPDGTVGLTCSTTIAAFCGANTCDLTLDAAKQDKSLCPASLSACGDFDVITKSSVDTATTYYYKGGELFAVDHFMLPGRHSCIAGPAMFDEPSCGPSSQNLPACNP